MRMLERLNDIIIPDLTVGHTIWPRIWKNFNALIEKLTLSAFFLGF